MRSFMRLKQRMNVLLPQPDGPMKAVRVFRGTASVTSSSAGLPPYETARSLTVNTFSRRSISARSRPRDTWAMRALSICGDSIWVMSSPLLAVAIAEEDGHRVHREHDPEQHDRSGGGQGLEGRVGLL